MIAVTDVHVATKPFKIVNVQMEEREGQKKQLTRQFPFLLMQSLRRVVNKNEAIRCGYSHSVCHFDSNHFYSIHTNFTIFVENCRCFHAN